MLIFKELFILIAVCLLGSGLCGCLMIFIADTYVVSILFMLQIILSGICVSVVVGTVIDVTPTQFRYKYNFYLTLKCSLNLNLFAEQWLFVWYI